MAAKKQPKGYKVTAEVPAIFESEDGKTVVFREVGAEVPADGACVARAVEAYPDCFEAV